MIPQDRETGTMLRLCGIFLPSIRKYHPTSDCVNMEIFNIHFAKASSTSLSESLYMSME